MASKDRGWLVNLGFGCIVLFSMYLSSFLLSIFGYRSQILVEHDGFVGAV